MARPWLIAISGLLGAVAIGAALGVAGRRGTLRSSRTQAPLAAGSQSARDKYKRAQKIVDGRVVRDVIPNRTSIESSLDRYEILPGVREVPFSAFDQMGSLRYYSIDEERRTKNLAAQIKQSGEINPLIVVEDGEGPYVLEGGHRFDALRELKAKAFPALVVLDLNRLTSSS